MTAALDTARKHFGRLDVAVNCAGIAAAEMTYNAGKGKVHSLDVFRKVVEVRI